MDAKLKDDWVKALRSGEYRQTRNALRDAAGFCCLGVLCDISGSGRWDTVIGPRFRFIAADDEPRVSFLPSVVLLSAGLSQKQESDVSAMNDHGQSFLEIADYIEQNIPADLVTP